MSAKYDPPYDEPRLDVGLDVQPRLSDLPWTVGVTDRTPEAQSFDPEYRTQGEAKVACQRIALAIADRVHGEELARLRTSVDLLHTNRNDAIAMMTAAHKAVDTWIDFVKLLRGAMINLLRANDSDVLIGTGVAYAFDEASIAVGLPVSNEHGVPFELLPLPAAPFKPTISECENGLLVQWGQGQNALYADPVRAAQDFGERYAAWKAGTR